MHLIVEVLIRHFFISLGLGNFCLNFVFVLLCMIKLIVDTWLSEIPKLSELMSRGVENGVEDLRMMDGQESMCVEPDLYCTKPVSGIIHSHSLLLLLLVCTYFLSR